MIITYAVYLKLQIKLDKLNGQTLNDKIRYD